MGVCWCRVEQDKSWTVVDDEKPALEEAVVGDDRRGIMCNTIRVINHKSNVCDKGRVPDPALVPACKCGVCLGNRLVEMFQLD